MRLTIIAVCLLFFTSLSAQEVSEERTSSDKIFQVADKMPEYPGGFTAMIEFVQDNLNYPEVKGEKLEGTVLVKFVIDRKGNVMGVDVLNSFQAEYDTEALRVVGEFPKWTPGENEGIPVNVQMTLPIKFKP